MTRARRNHQAKSTRRLDMTSHGADLRRAAGSAATLLSIMVAAGCALDDRNDETRTGVTDSLTLPVPVARVAFRIPQDSEIVDPEVLASVRRGRALMRYTRDSLPSHVGNRLQCVSCHPADGTMRDVMPWVGIYARFPQYRSRSASVQIIEDRINDCFKRSMNGRPLVPESRDMRDIVAYFAFLSTGYPVGAHVDGQSIPAVPPLDGDTVRAQATFLAKCAACHGLDGQGTDLAPPLWGPHSYNIGAGMARVRTAAAFIRKAMPQNAPGTLTDQEAYDLATYINTRPRPDFKGKELDWPEGDPPPDVAYPTLAASRRAAGRGDSASRPRPDR